MWIKTSNPPTLTNSDTIRFFRPLRHDNNYDIIAVSDENEPLEGQPVVHTVATFEEAIIMLDKLAYAIRCAGEHVVTADDLLRVEVLP
jgi:hypothetical protein